MPTLGLALVFALTTALVFAAFAAASRVARPGSDAALSVCMMVCAEILLPIHALGFARRLSAGYLAPASLLVGALTFFATMPGRTPAQHARAAWMTFRETIGHLARLLFVDVRRAGPIAWAAALGLAFAFGYTTLLTWLLPADSYDGSWYHDIMVGHAIQSHSYDTIPTTMNLTQQANGYPRAGEMLGLWWVIFSGRRLLEWPSVLAMIPMALACYGLCMRYAPTTAIEAVRRKWRAAAFLTAASFILLPGVRLEMRSTYIDGIFAAFSLASVYFAADPKLDAKRGAVTCIALGLSFGSKGHALLFAPMLAILALLILAVREGRRGWRRTLGALFVGTAFLVALGGVSYLRNLVEYRNPLYPYTMTVGPWHWEGVVELGDFSGEGDVTRDLFALPTLGADWPDIRRGGYGLITGFVLLPAMVLAVVALVFGFGRQVVRSIARRHLTTELGERFVLICTVAIVGISLLLSPAIWSLRYNMYAVGFGFALVHFLAGVLRASTFAGHFGAASLVTSGILWSWSIPGWWGERGWKELTQVLARPRSTDVGAPTFLDPKTTILRERELRAGDVAVFTDDTEFPSYLWNDSFSNVLVYIPLREPEAFLAAADAAHARWVAVGVQSTLLKTLRERTTEWSEVGPLHHWNHNGAYAFRRLPPSN